MSDEKWMKMVREWITKSGGVCVIIEEEKKFEAEMATLEHSIVTLLQQLSANQITRAQFKTAIDNLGAQVQQKYPDEVDIKELRALVNAPLHILKEIEKCMRDEN